MPAMPRRPNPSPNMSPAYKAMLEDAKKRRAKFLAMSKTGLTVQEVADKMGVTKQRASELIARARRDVVAGVAATPVDNAAAK